MSTCSVCGNPKVTKKEKSEVIAKLNNMPIEDFELFVADAGISENWQSAIVCEECYLYYTA